MNKEENNYVHRADEQELCEKAHQLLSDFLLKHEEEIAPTFWLGPIIGILAATYKKNGHSFSQFRQAIADAVYFYGYQWDDL
jgi:hypothetical protein